jgi:hypothetical protein
MFIGGFLCRAFQSWARRFVFQTLAARPFVCLTYVIISASDTVVNNEYRIQLNIYSFSWILRCMREEKPETPPEVLAYLSRIGSIKTEAKTRASRETVKKAQAASRKDPLTLPCTCKGGESLKASDHVTTCPRGRLLWQRERAAAKKQKEAA